MLKRTLIIVTAIVILFGCVLPVAAEELSVDYYITKSGFTTQIFPGDDWQYIKDMAVEEPITVVLTTAWLDWDANTFAIVVNDITNGDMGCGVWFFADVSLIPTKDYKNAMMLGEVGMSCEAFFFGLATALNYE